MLTITIQQVLDDAFPDCRNHVIYRFYDNDTTFYIGKSLEIEERLATHLGVSLRYAPSKVLALVNANRPDALKWPIDLYTIADCLPLMREYLIPLGWNVETMILPQFFEIAIMKSEETLINHYGPCLNKLNNNNALPLPKRYTRPGESSARYLKI